MLQFANTSAFYLLLVLPICFLLYSLAKKWRSNQLKKLGDVHLVTPLIVGTNATWQKSKFILLLLSASCLILSLAKPIGQGNSETIKTSSRELVIALDVSNSMNAIDVAPSRLAKAKQFISKLIDTNNLDKFGLVVFAGNAYISVPITIDAASINMNLSAINTNTIPNQGTNIGEAILRAHDCFNTKREGGKAIIIISDGEDHEEKVRDAIDVCQKDNIKIICVGVGTEEGSKIIDPNTNEAKRDEDGSEVISKFNSETLSKLANDAQGNFFHLQNAEQTALQVNNVLNALETHYIEEEQTTVYTQYFQWFLVPAIICLLILNFYKPRKNNK